MDIGSVKKSSSGGARFCLLIVDEATRFQWSYFLTSKKNVKDLMLELLKHLKNINLNVKYIRCDDAGENKAAKTLLEQEGHHVNFEFTSKGTPQYNGIVERRFATLYARVRAMLHSCGYPDTLKYKLWAECASTAGLLFNIQSKQADEKSPHEQMYNRLPAYARNLKQFGRLGAVLTSSKSTLKAKLQSRGIVKYFVGYAPAHAHYVYRMYNPDTGRVSVTRDIRWMNRLIGDDE